MEELKACPFCGDSVQIEMSLHVVGRVMIACRNCSMSIFGDNEEKIIKAWNTRYTEPEKQPKTGEVKEILDYLSEAKRIMTGNSALRGYSVTKPNKRLIGTRIKEGHTIDDFKRVIDHKSSSWKGTMFAEYLRPSTLFSATHFPEYLCEAEAVMKRSISELDSAIEGMIE